MTKPRPLSRRTFIQNLSAGLSAAVIPAAVLGREGATAAGERITFGIIGIGPRCTYDVKAMLPFTDVRCVAIADVQAKRRDAGKALVDEHYENRDCKLYRDFR